MEDEEKEGHAVQAPEEEGKGEGEEVGMYIVHQVMAFSRRGGKEGEKK